MKISLLYENDVYCIGVFLLRVFILLDSDGMYTFLFFISTGQGKFPIIYRNRISDCKHFTK